MVHILRGYAVCFNDIEELCGEDTVFRPDVFMQSVKWPVGLRFGSHHARDLASTINGTLSLFQDDYGLGFEAHLLNSTAAARSVSEVTSRRFHQCSGLFQFAKTQRIGVGDKSVICVQAARIDHIAIVAAPVFRNTGVWSADVPRAELPVRLQELAAHWHRGNAVASSYDGIVVRCCPATPPRAKPPVMLAKPPAPKPVQHAITHPVSRETVSSVPVYQTWIDGRPHYSQGSHPPVITTPFGGLW